MLSRFGFSFENCSQNQKKRECYIAKYATQNAKMTFDQKMPTIFFNAKSENIGQMCVSTL